MHAVLSGGRLRAATNTACGLSKELKARVRSRAAFPFDPLNVPSEVSPPLLDEVNKQVKNILSIGKRNPTLCPSIIIASFRSLTKTDELPLKEWMAYHNEADHMPFLEQLRRKSAELAWEYKRMRHTTDAITAYWCVGYGLQDAIEKHRRRTLLTSRGERLNTAIFGSLSSDENDIKVLNMLSKILTLEPKLEHDAIVELIEKYTLAIGY